MKIAVSLLSAYLYCPRKVFLEKVLQMHEPPKQPLILGTIRHQTLQRVSLGEEKLVSLLHSPVSFADVHASYEQLYTRFLREVIKSHTDSLHALFLDPLDAYYHALPSLLREAQIRATNTFSFAQKSVLEGTELWKALTPKIISEVKVESEELQLVGVVDQLHDFGSHVIPVELKTGKTPRQGVWPGHRIQAAAYALVLRENKQYRYVQEAVVHYLDSNEKRVVVMNPFMEEEIVTLIEEVQELLSNAVLPEICDSKQKCVSCGLRTKCYDNTFMQNALRALPMPLRVQSTLV